MATEHGQYRSWEPWAAGLTAALILGLSSLTHPMVWDEGDYLARSDQIRTWGGSVLGHGPGPHGLAALGAETIARDWPTTTREEGHPALGLILFALAQTFGRGLEPLPAARMASVLLTAIAMGALYARASAAWGRPTAIAATVAWLLMPRAFAHAQFATLDGPLTASWVIAWALFPWAERGRWQALAWGAVLGCGLSLKFTGWLIPLPFLGMACLWRRRETWQALAMGLPAALATFWLLNPPLWHVPVSGLAEFFRLNLGRREHFNLSGYFLGEMYDLDHPLPWYNTLVWTVATTPLPTLLAALVGVGLAIRSLVQREDASRWQALLAAHWLLLLVVRALPGAPAHDNERLILPSFAFLAVFAGVGYGWLWSMARSRAARVVLSIALASPATSLYWYHPQCLSYYSLSMGGLRGAAAAGLEPTYYWDGFDADVSGWLAANMAAGERVRFSAASPMTLSYLVRTRALPREFVEFDEPPEAPFRWYVLQHRPSGYTTVDHWLLDHAQPAWQKFIRPPTWGWGPWKLDVPLISVYAAEDYRQAVAATRE